MKKSLDYVVKDFGACEMEVCEKYAEVILTRKITEYDREKILNSTAAYNVLVPWFANYMETQEVFIVAYLDTSNRVNLVQRLSMGGITATVVDIRLILSTALLTLSTRIILAHNHPSGNVNPSTQDEQITKKLKDACNMFDITLIDHLIITQNDYYSLADNGLF